MGDELAGANLNRSNSLAAMSLAIFTFVLFFMHPGFANGRIDPGFFQFTLIVIGVATFAFVFASFDYYRASLKDRFADRVRDDCSRRADGLWLLGQMALFLVPSLILFAVGVVVVGSVWCVLWLSYLFFVASAFGKVQTPSWFETHWPHPKPQSTDGDE